MKVGIIDHPSQILVNDGYKITDPQTEEFEWIEGECKILRSDVEGAKEFAKELIREKNPVIRREWEKAYYKDIKEKYASGQVAGALLLKVWEWAKETEDEDD